MAEAIETRLHHSEQTVTLLAGANEKMSTTVEAQNTTIHVLSATIERMLGTPGETAEAEATDLLARDLAPVVLETRLRDAIAQQRYNCPYEVLDGSPRSEIHKIVDAIAEELNTIAEEDAHGSE
jgi:hypothetical protein